MIIPENKSELDKLKEERRQIEAKESAKLTLIEIIGQNYTDIIKVLNNTKEEYQDQEEFFPLYNEMYEEAEKYKNYLIELHDKHSTKLMELREEYDDILLSEGGAIAEQVMKHREEMKYIPPNRPMFEETEKLIENSQYKWMKLRRTFDYRTWQIVDKRNNDRVRFEATPEEISAIIKEITQKK